jgi:hypothetical protein
MYRTPALALAVALALLCGAQIAFAESDVTPPTVVGLVVEPTYIDTSQGTQIITVTAHITDDLSGCPVDDWCLRFFFVPLLGPEAQGKSRVVGPTDRISGTLTDGLYQTTVALPQHSYEGRWVLDQFVVFDNVRNRCVWAMRNPGSPNGCPYAVGEIFVVNRVDDFVPPPQLRLPYITAD